MAGLGPDTTGDAAAMQDLLIGLHSLVQRFDAGKSASSTPVSAWVSDSLGVGQVMTKVAVSPAPALGQGSVALTSPVITVASGV